MQNYEMLAHWARREIQAVTKLPTGSSQIVNQEKNPRPFSCLQCGRNYMRKDSLMRHIKWECGKDPLFQCPFCPHRCKRKPHWLRHIRRQHKDSIGDMENYLHSYKPLPQSK
ncbi:Similar to lola: Longitudinals lacking protein [Cotesia congregata]|uniref:Isoforms A/B/D/L (Drosophila melanogaster) n=1 Tax=Cotesia congregata TaxID=51543 RepID=A0A8J2HJ78_COTCN|nr:Similar to lola: Longitudinals lacking protein [Cotesia congregata]